jgi:hypothetical protein
MHSNRPKKDSNDYKKKIEDPIKKIIKDNPGLFKNEKSQTNEPMPRAEGVGLSRQKYRKLAEEERRKLLSVNQKPKEKSSTSSAVTPDATLESYTSKGVTGIAAKGRRIKK